MSIGGLFCRTVGGCIGELLSVVGGHIGSTFSRRLGGLFCRTVGGCIGAIPSVVEGCFRGDILSTEPGGAFLLLVAR